ncbi:predicted protein [Naegleria gruberi]|uniref:Predicted protein n=1 Tax=Naegleria gruberi TaxID=5762 RepID=D2VIS2_NAEGR|nr:uncharacterized protein NAEGRDRAFT_68776 [Naegleria gruberi]EFC43324.1 predicted protein [Naegleria gruberi]|eukprot:XP_002676068.1 predicted protein [Naegleria gruberi strain NEG-M]
MKVSDQLLESAYSVAIDHDPITLEKQIHLALGLHSCKDGKNERKDLNLVIVLDISGSMSSSMSGKGSESKMKVANKVICEIIDNLKDFERLGIVLFDDKAETFLPLTIVQDLEKKSLKERVMKITEKGSTNFEAGMKRGIDLFSTMDSSDLSNSNRIIYLTDACPNVGGTDSLDVLTKDANSGPYGILSTFIGIGLDFNSEIVEELTKVRGCNYFSVKSSEEFKKILNEDFNYIVTPICYNVKLTLESKDYEIEKCFGTNMAEQATGEIMKLDSCSAGQLDERGVKGGIVLLRLKQKSQPIEDSIIKLTLSYENEEGKKFRQEKQVTIKTDLDGNLYETNGIRKAVALVRYVEIVKDYLDKKGNQHSKSNTSPEWNSKFLQLSEIFTNEMNEIGDELMKQELEVINKLIYYSK